MNIQRNKTLPPRYLYRNSLGSCVLYRSVKMNQPTVTVKQGKLVGTVSKDIDGNNFYSFKGIPYATPPLGKLRFKAPLPPSPWTGVLQATKDGNCCYSKDLFTKKIVGSEDCLNLNVYTPRLPTTDSNLLPVMVWIHGGGFTTGSNSSDIYGPEFLITSNVVIVVINYRLGLLGFLSIDDPSLGIPGNAGFKDMIMALKWVQNNIQQFSGDSNNVTVFGESAAGGAVHLLMLSPMSRGLFHKAIAQSGCALNPWSRAKRFDRKMYDVFDYNESSNENIAEYLRNLPVEKLLECQFKMGYFLDVNRMNPFGLVIEREFAEQGEVPFLTEDPVDVILSKNFMDVPLMIGFTKMEGLLVHTYRPTAYENMLKDFEANVPHLLGYKTGTNESKAVAEKIKSFYFGDEDPAQNKNQFYEMVTDNLFLYGIYSTVKKHSFNSTSPVYFYRLSLETSLKFLQVLMKDKEEGAAHGDDVAYLFKNIFNKPLLRDTLEYTSVKCIVKLWTNFAYYGNPTPDNNSTLIWEKVNKKQVGFLDIGNELTFFNDLQQTSLQFWDKIYEESSQGYKFSCRNPTLLKKCKGRL